MQRALTREDTLLSKMQTSSLMNLGFLFGVLEQKKTANIQGCGLRGVIFLASRRKENLQGQPEEIVSALSKQ